MITRGEVRKWALSFDGVSEEPRFNKTSFRVKGKIVATLNLEHDRACVRLSPIDQDVFCSFKEYDLSCPKCLGKKWVDINKFKESSKGYVQRCTNKRLLLCSTS